jgi:hypothetical protein
VTPVSLSYSLRPRRWKRRHERLAEAACELLDAWEADGYVAPTVESSKRARQRLHAARDRVYVLAEHERRHPPTKGVPG